MSKEKNTINNNFVYILLTYGKNMHSQRFVYGAKDKDKGLIKVDSYQLYGQLWDEKIQTEGYIRVAEKYAWESAAYYWTKPKLNNGNSIKDEIDNINIDNVVLETVNDNGNTVTVEAKESIFWVSYLVNGGYNGIQKRIDAFEKIESIIGENE